jgi:hypothetical protein
VTVYPRQSLTLTCRAAKPSDELDLKLWLVLGLFCAHPSIRRLKHKLISPSNIFQIFFTAHPCFILGLVCTNYKQYITPIYGYVYMIRSRNGVAGVYRFLRDSHPRSPITGENLQSACMRPHSFHNFTCHGSLAKTPPLFRYIARIDTTLCIEIFHGSAICVF